MRAGTLVESTGFPLVTVTDTRAGRAWSRRHPIQAGDRHVPQWGPLPLRGLQVYLFAMIELPASYKEFLADKSQLFIDTVRPVLMQSAADKLHGVRVSYNPGSTGHQAHLDDSIPFGVIVEDID